MCWPILLLRRNTKSFGSKLILQAKNLNHQVTINYKKYLASAEANRQKVVEVNK